MNVLLAIGLFFSVPSILVWGIGLLPTIVLVIIYFVANHFVIRKQQKVKTYWIISIIIVFGFWFLLVGNYSYNSLHNYGITKSIEPNFKFISNDRNNDFTIKSNKQSISMNDIDYLVTIIGFENNKIRNLKLLLDEKDDGMDMSFKGNEMISCRNIHNIDHCINIDEKDDFICTSLVGGITNVCREYNRGSNQIIIDDFRMIFNKTRSLKESMLLKIGSQMIDSRTGEQFNYIQIWNNKRVETNDIEAVFQVLPKKKERFLFSVNEGLEPNVDQNRNQYYFIYDLLGAKKEVSNEEMQKYFKYMGS